MFGWRGSWKNPPKFMPCWNAYAKLSTICAMREPAPSTLCMANSVVEEFCASFDKEHAGACCCTAARCPSDLVHWKSRKVQACDFGHDDPGGGMPRTAKVVSPPKALPFDCRRAKSSEIDSRASSAPGATSPGSTATLQPIVATACKEMSQLSSTIAATSATKYTEMGTVGALSQKLAAKWVLYIPKTRKTRHTGSPKSKYLECVACRPASRAPQKSSCQSCGRLRGLPVPSWGPGSGSQMRGVQDMVPSA